MLFVCHLEPSEFYKGLEEQKVNDKKKIGHTSVSIVGRQMVTNSMDNKVLIFNMDRLSDESCTPIRYTGHKSTFFVKPALEGQSGLLASGS